MITKKQLQDVLEEKISLALITGAYAYNTLAAMDSSNPDNRNKKIKSELTIINYNSMLNDLERFIQDEKLLELYQEVKPKLQAIDDQITFKIKEDLATDPNLGRKIIAENKAYGFGMSEEDIKRFIRD